MASSYRDLLDIWEPVIGLEVHVQLNTQTKLFCACPRKFGDSPNTHTCPVCLGMPGALPVANKRAIELAVQLGLAFDFSINTTSVFARKNYFYPDLPKGYQISQFEKPINEHGYMDVLVNGKSQRIGITRAHLEEDAGKLIHANGGSHVDLNRCGTPLIEIVSEPEMHSKESVRAYLENLKQTIQYIEVSDCDMEKGNLRVDLNISLRKRGSKALGIRREIKNLNSFRFVEKAIEYEVCEQARLLDAGDEVVQSTLLWDEKQNKSITIRSKEDAPDYRYFPDSDLPPIVVSQQEIDEIYKNLPELPAVRKRRFINDYHLNEMDAHRLTQEKEWADFYESVLKNCNAPTLVSNWILSRLMGALNNSEQSLSNSTITSVRFADFIQLIDEGKLSSQLGKDVLKFMVQDNRPVMKIIEEEGLLSVSEDTLQVSFDAMLTEFPEEVERFKNGDVKLRGFFMGQMMKKTQGKADPKQLNELLNKLK